ncbi:MAG: hypothetical protein M3P49_11590 [Actinomycetota bacterium]|nr:hypothetical protein [Actinomycetota bacterium]
MGFETFDKRAATASKSPMVTIQRGGAFSLNEAARQLIGSPEAVELLYDRESQLIGFRPVALTSPRAFPVRPQGQNAKTYMVAGKMFAKHYQLDVSRARRYAVEASNGLLVLDLNSDSVDVTGPRAVAENGQDATEDSG